MDVHRRGFCRYDARIDEGPDGKLIAPTNKKFHIEFCTVAHWKNGEIVEEKLFYDLVGLLKTNWSYVSYFVRSLRFLHSALLSVPNCKALPDMRRTFQFVDHCNGVILNRNLALAGGVYQKLVASQAKLSRTLPWLQFWSWSGLR